MLPADLLPRCHYQVLGVIARSIQCIFQKDRSYNLSNHNMENVRKIIDTYNTIWPIIITVVKFNILTVLPYHGHHPCHHQHLNLYCCNITTHHHQEQPQQQQPQQQQQALNRDPCRQFLLTQTFGWGRAPPNFDSVRLASYWKHPYTKVRTHPHRVALITAKTISVMYKRKNNAK